MTVTVNHDHLAHRLVSEGTRAHRGALAALAEAVRDLAPGAAAALTDWDGSEVARLRAYAVAREAIRTEAQARLDQIRVAAHERGGFVLIA